MGLNCDYKPFFERYRLCLIKSSDVQAYQYGLPILNTSHDRIHHSLFGTWVMGIDESVSVKVTQP